MGTKRPPGLTKRNGIWHIDKIIYGRRIRQSCKTDSLGTAQELLARKTEQVRQEVWFGVRPERSFQDAALRYIRDHRDKKSIRNDVQRAENLMPWIGQVPISRIHQGTLAAWIESRREEGRTQGTINHGIKLVNRILRLAASEWVDEQGLTWLEHARSIRLLPDKQKRQPYPLSWPEQTKLFAALPGHLREMSLFAVNTGCRDQEICQLSWEWEVKVPELDTSVFIIPGSMTKNGDERLVVLNDVAASVVNACRGRHPKQVFTYRGQPTTRMMNKAWLRARKEVDLPQVRVHDLKHTFGRRLRAAGVCFEDRQDLLGHRSYRVTTHYSAPELTHLVQMANSVAESDQRRPELVMLKRTAR